MKWKSGDRLPSTTLMLLVNEVNVYAFVIFMSYLVRRIVMEIELNVNEVVLLLQCLI